MIYLDDAERGIAAASIQNDGFGPLGAAVNRCNDWVAHAAPIIRAYLAMEEACMASAICEVHYGRDQISIQKTRDYREADGYRKEAQAKMLDLIEGIRDNYICDHSAPYLRDASEDEIGAADEFNEALGRAVISVDAAVKVVGDDL